MDPDGQRPSPSSVSDTRTLRRWYWLRSELVEIARRTGLPTTGGKIELTERICASFDGHAPAPAASPHRSRDALPVELSDDVVLQPGQRCTQPLRTWMVTQVGPTFSFDAPMRAAVSRGGITLGDLVARWHSTRRRAPSDIGPQFELNRFSRAWHADHPGSTHVQMLAGWADHRRRPRDPDGSA